MLSRTSRVLVLSALAVVTAFVAIELPRRRARDRAAEEGARVARFDPAAVDAVTIVRPSDTLTFVRRGDAWRMTAPIEDRAEPAAVVALVHAVADARAERNLGRAPDDGPFGLDAPRAVILMSAGADTVARLSVGGETVDHAWSYARAGSRDVLLIPTDVHRAATRARDDYRSHRVVSLERPDVRSFRLTASGHATRWTRGPRGWFTVEQSDTIAGDSVAVEAVLRRLRGLRVASFVSPQDTAGSFASADGVIRVYRIRAGPITVRFARRPNGVWRTRVEGESRVGAAEGDVDGLLAQTTTALRERRLLQFSPPDAARIELTSPGGSGALVRAAGRWSFPNPSLGSIDPERAADFVRALRALKWTDAPPPGRAAPAGAPAFSLVVRDEGGTILDEMKAWAPPEGGGRWPVVSRSGRGPWLIEASELESLAAAFQGLRPR